MNTGSSFFDQLDHKIDELLKVDHAENALIDLYSGLTSALKDRIGTAAGITGLSEYVFFQYIKRSLEVRSGAMFRNEGLKDTLIFRSEKLLLTHDIDISKFVDVGRQKTDIAVFSVSGDNQYRLLAAFELKVYVTGPEVLEDLIKRFENLAQKTTALLYPVVFLSGYARELELFCSRHPERAFLISNTDQKYRISINQAIDKIVSSRLP
jgi:hypothetical protein